MILRSVPEMFNINCTVEVVCAGWMTLTAECGSFQLCVLDQRCACRDRKPMFVRVSAAPHQRVYVVCRCLFPDCPAPQNCARCDEAGVLGTVPGAIGTLQATEAIKLLTGVGQPLHGRLLLYDALAAQFRTVKLRAPRAGCVACNGGAAEQSELSKAGGPAGYDYCAFTGGQSLQEARAPVKLLAPEQRVSCQELRDMLHGKGADNGSSKQAQSVKLLDVRAAELFATGRLHGSVHVPINQVDCQADRLCEEARAEPDAQVVVVCRRGNDSQIATHKLLGAGMANVRDLEGGLHAWARTYGGLPIV